VCFVTADLYEPTSIGIMALFTNEIKFQKKIGAGSFWKALRGLASTANQSIVSKISCFASGVYLVSSPTLHDSL